MMKETMHQDQRTNLCDIDVGYQTKNDHTSGLILVNDEQYKISRTNTSHVYKRITPDFKDLCKVLFLLILVAFIKTLLPPLALSS